MQSFESHSESKKVYEKAILVGLIYKDQSEDKLKEYLEELEFLTQTAGAVVLKKFTQKLPHPNKRTFVGSGKLEEIQEYVELHEIDLVIFDDEISPSQQANLEEALKVKVVDRANLILDIFANRAQTAQSKTQVELAQLQYILPRLKGMWTHLERQKGGIGMRGPGETEIETDRRIIQTKISRLRKKLDEISKQNETRRKNRGELIRVALVGYTNVGKSTLLNLLAKSDVFAENKLFATLDTTVRKVAFEGIPFLISDTVGFIRKLPTHLIESFKSTLDEAKESDILVHVVDIAHPQFEDHIKSVETTLADLKINKQNTIMVFNKMDLFRSKHLDKFLHEEERLNIVDQLKEQWAKSYPDCVFISAKNKENIKELRSVLVNAVKKQYKIRYPYKTGSFYNF